MIALLLLETFWLLPALTARAARIIAGNSAPPSNAHFFYIAFEIIKTILLFAFGISIVKSHMKFE